MNYRKLGRTNFEISEIGFGAWGIGGKQWLGNDDEESLTSLRRAIDLGVNLIDTALAYGDGHSERLTGRVVRETGHKVHVATKVPPKNNIWPVKPGDPIGDVFPYDHIMLSAEQSLRNLGLETIDLLQLHTWTAEWAARDEWRRAFEDLKRTGKIRATGISLRSHLPESGVDAIRTGLIDALQVLYNIFDQSPERELFPLCQKENIGVLARVPLDEGGLTGTIDVNTTFPAGDFRAGYFRGDRKKELVRRLSALRADLAPDASLPETALRFCISHPAVSTVIPGMRKPKHVETNTAVSDLGPLPAATLAILRRHTWDRSFYN